MVCFTAICKQCLGCDCQITCNPSRHFWGLWWVRRRKDRTSGPAWPRGTHGPSKAQVGRSGPLASPARDATPSQRFTARWPTPPRDVYAPTGGRQRLVQDSGTHPCDGADPLGLPGTACSLYPGLGPLSEAPRNSVCCPSAVPQMLRPPPQESR